ncbi:MAG: biotin/lipoyl-binding protein, partial [Myxococcota bacterium]|nr:biotin/lipoyl-binding protein [Myxococcota bacterium]
MNKLRYLALALPLAAGSYLWLGRDTPPAAATTLVARPAVLVAPGRVEPQRDVVQLAFEAQGRIAEILVDEGAAVKAGDALARLDDRLARARVTASEAGLAQAKARYM